MKLRNIFGRKNRLRELGRREFGFRQSCYFSDVTVALLLDEEDESEPTFRFRIELTNGQLFLGICDFDDLCEDLYRSMQIQLGKHWERLRYR